MKTLFPSADRLSQLYDAVVQIDHDPVLRKLYRWFLTLHTGSLPRAISREEIYDIDDLLDGIPLLLPFLPLRLDRDRRVSKSSLKWVGNAISVAQFFEREGRFPADTRQSHTEEGMLGSWLIRQRRASVKHQLDPVHESYLDHAMPTWRNPDASAPTAEEITQQWETLCDSADSKGDSPLAWYVQFMSAERNDSPSREQYESVLAELGATPLLLPVFPLRAQRGGPFSKNARSWCSHALEVAEFIETYGFRPRTATTQDATYDSDEHRLRMWLQPLLTSMKFNAVRIQRTQFLDVFAPGWSDGKFTRYSQEERFEQIVIFVYQNGRWPRQSSLEPEEKNLAQALTRLRSQHRDGGGISAEAQDLMESALGGNWTEPNIPPLLTPGFRIPRVA